MDTDRSDTTDTLRPSQWGASPAESDTHQQGRLLEAARYLTASLDLKEVLTRIGTVARDILKASSCTIYFLEPDGRTLVPMVALDPLYEQAFLSTSLDVDASFTGQAVKAKKALYFNDAASNPSGLQVPGTPEEEEERVIVAPFIVHDTVLGAMRLDRAGAFFSEPDLALAETFAAYAATALRNARMYEDLAREVQERRRAEEALKESEVRYRSLFERVPVGLYRTMPDGRILDANPALVQMLGYPDRESLLQLGAPDLFAAPDQRRGEMAMLESREVLHDVEIQLRRRDGEVIWVRDSVRAVRDSAGTVLYFEGSLEDVTESKRAREEIGRHTEELQVAYRQLQDTQHALVQVGRLAAMDQIGVTVRHEINNPLTGVLGNAQWLLTTDRTLSAESREVLQEVFTAALRIRDVVRRLDEIEDRPVPYVGRTMMIDLHGKEEPDDRGTERKVT